MSSEDESNNIVIVINEKVGISENEIVNTRLLFSLTEPVEMPGTITDSSNIKILKNESNSVIGFEVSITHPNDEKIQKAHLEIRRLLNILSIKLGRYIDHKRPEVFVTHKSGKTTGTVSFTIDAILVRRLDLDLNSARLSSIMGDSDPTLTQQLSDAASGIKAYDDMNYKESIRTLWLTIENESNSLSKDYKSLRDGLSHSEINSPAAIAILKNDFGLNLKTKIDSVKTPKGVYIDTNDPTNRRILKNEATILKAEVLRILETKTNI